MVLEKIADRQVISKEDLKKKITEISGKDAIVDIATKKLLEKKLIAVVCPIGSTCYVITQSGARALVKN
jgi:hypothetical protein